MLVGIHDTQAQVVITTVEQHKQYTMDGGSLTKVYPFMVLLLQVTKFRVYKLSLCGLCN